MSSDWPDRPPVVIALGANLGDPEAQLRDALNELQAWTDCPLQASSFWSSTPDDCPPGSPRFVNAVAVLRPRLGETPETILDRLQDLERLAGRRPKLVLNEARPLDLDLIAWGGEVRHSPRLILPHPRAHLRRFVLAPLAELLPDLILPGQSLPVHQLLLVAPPDPDLHRLPC